MKFDILPLLLCCTLDVVAGTLDEGAMQEDSEHAYKLHLITDPLDANVDIVAVHGLDGHWKDSWTAENGVFWLQDLLPIELPRARAFSFGHDSRTRGAERPLTQDIWDHGKFLIWSLSNERALTNTESRPLVFIGHSLGGLVVKSALLYSDMARVGHLERYKSIKISTGGIFFLATPHQGGEGVALAQIVRRVYSIFSHTNPKLLEQIAPQSEWLQDLQSRYNSISQDFDTAFFYETQETPVPLLGRLLVVPKFSAVVPGARNAEDVSMPADHKTIAKFSGHGDPNFERVVKRLQVLASHVQRRVRQKWNYWSKIKDMDLQQSLLQIQDAGFLEDSISSTTEPHRRADEFRVGLMVDQLQNRHFVGRKSLFSDIDRHLEQNTTLDSDLHVLMRVVVLYGTGGVGKTQIALQYAYLSRNKYDSVFWIDGSSLETAGRSIRRSLEKISNHYQAQLRVESADPKLRQITKALQKAESTRETSEEFVEVRRGLIQAFINWLSLDDNKFWLIILDNVDDLESFDFREVIPRAGWGAVIVTSRRSDLSVMWDTIEVPTMQEEEAIDLFQSMSKLGLQGSDDRSDAQRLVTTLGFLPLAIVQAGSFIAVQRPPNPITTYLHLLSEHPATVLNYRIARAGWDYRNETVLTTWEISFGVLTKQMPKAAFILQLCAFMDRDHISEDLFAQGLPNMTHIDVQLAFNVLMSFSFIQRTSDFLYFKIHPLVHLWARVRLDPKEQQDIALEVLRVLYRSKCRFNIAHLRSIYSFYKESTPCEQKFPSYSWLLEYGAMDSLETFLLSVKGLFQDLVLSVYRIFWMDAASSYDRPWEIFDEISNDCWWSELDWPLCQAVEELGMKHPRVLYRLGNFAHTLLDRQQFDEALLVYEWLLLVRSHTPVANHAAITGAMMGVSRALTWGMPEQGLHGQGLPEVCPTALYYAIKVYQGRTDDKNLKMDGRHMRAARLVLGEVECTCYQVIQNLDPMGYYDWDGDFGDHKSALKWISLINSILPAITTISQTPFDIIQRPEANMIDVNFTLQDLQARWDLQDILDELVIDPYSYTGCTGLYQEFIDEVSTIWQEGWMCIRILAAVALFRLFTSGSRHDDQLSAGLWLQRLLGVSPESYIYVECCCDNGFMGNICALSADLKHPHNYLKHTFSYALQPFVRDSPGYLLAPGYLGKLFVARVFILHEVMGYRLLLSGPDWLDCLCLVVLGSQMRYLLALEPRRGSMVHHPAIVHAVEEMINLVAEDQSHSCFRDLRRVSMCRADEALSRTGISGDQG